MNLDRSVYKKFNAVSVEAAKYHRLRVMPPANVEAAFNEALFELRDHLNDLGYRMPQPIYPYDPHNKATHRFIGSTTGKHAMLNPEYMYKDSWKINNGKDI